METLDLKGAAVVLHLHPETVRELAQAGTIPAAKIGRAWVFVKEDLIEFIRRSYPKCKMKTASTSEVALGGLESTGTVRRLDDLLGRKTKPKPRNSTTG
jgi:excisionase family DNA binding protein